MTAGVLTNVALPGSDATWMDRLPENATDPTASNVKKDGTYLRNLMT